MTSHFSNFPFGQLLRMTKPILFVLGSVENAYQLAETSRKVREDRFLARPLMCSDRISQALACSSCRAVSPVRLSRLRLFALVKLTSRLLRDTRVFNSSIPAVFLWHSYKIQSLYSYMPSMRPK